MALELIENGGASRDRTDDLIVANDALFHFAAFAINHLQAMLVHNWY